MTSLDQLPSTGSGQAGQVGQAEVTEETDVSMTFASSTDFGDIPLLVERSDVGITVNRVFLCVTWRYGLGLTALRLLRLSSSQIPNPKPTQFKPVHPVNAVKKGLPLRLCDKLWDLCVQIFHFGGKR